MVTPRDRVVSGSSTSQVTDQDSVYDHYVAATIAHEFDVHITKPFGTDVTVTNLTPDVATLDDQLRATIVDSGGTSRIRFNAPRGVRFTSFDVSQPSPGTHDAFKYFVDGSLARAIANTIDDAVSGKTPNNTNLPIFGSDHSINPALWMSGVNFTCIPRLENGCLISPDILVEANHYPHPGFYFSGDIFRYVIDSRTISAGPGLGNTDIRICKLDSALPGSIVPAKSFPANWRAYLPGMANGVPLVFTNQFRTLRVGEMIAAPIESTESTVVAPRVMSRRPWYSDVIVGDSGSPAIIPFAGGSVLQLCWHNSSGGPTVADFQSAIAAAITEMGGTQSTVADLSAYPTYPI